MVRWTMPMVSYVSARRVRNSVTDEFSRARRSRILMAACDDSSDFSGWLKSRCNWAIFQCVLARLIWNDVTDGLSLVSFSWIERARWSEASASAGWPVPWSTMLKL